MPEGYGSTDRFIRAATLRERYSRELTAGGKEPVAIFFDMAGAVSPPEGAVPAATGDGWQTTLYTCCMDGARGRYCYTTAENPRRIEVGF